MIKTAAEYNSSKVFIDKELELYDYALSERMSSEEVNLFFQDTEFYLDLLAEKLRVLEDMVDYLEFYGDTKINKAKKLISEKEQVLRGMASKLTEKGAVSVALTWDTNPLVANFDRDGSDLDTAQLTPAYCVTSSSTLTHEQKPQAITKSSDIQCFSDNIGSCAETDYYITEYDLDAPKEIEEYIEIKIGAPDDFDFLSYTPTNCEVEYMGKNHLDHIVLKLSANNMHKELENFNYSNFKDSNLNSIDSIKSRPDQVKPIYEQELELYKLQERELSEEYLDRVKDYWLTNELNGTKKEKENASK